MRLSAIVPVALACALAARAEAQLVPAPGHLVFSIPTPDTVTGGVIALDDALLVGQGSFGSGTQHVIRLDADGATTLASGFNSIGGMAYDTPTDTLFIADNGGDQSGATTGDTVYALPAARTRSTSVAAESIELLPSGSIPHAADVITEPGGTLLVADAAGGTGGSVLRLTDEMPTALIGGLGYTAGLALGPAGTSVFVGDVDGTTFAGSVSEYDLNGSFVRELAGGLSGAFDHVFDDDGNLLVTGGSTEDFTSGTVIKIAPDGTVDELARGFVYATGVDFSTSTQAVYVLDSGATEVTVLCRDADGDSTCDRAETCSGERKCDDGDPCTGIEACVGDICVYGTPLVCDDGDPCTADRCSAGVGCVTQTIGGVEGLACIFAGGLTAPACDGEQVPDRVGKRVHRALRLLDRAEHESRAKKTKRLVKRAERHLKRAGRIARKAASRSQNPISTACANELEVTIEGARQAALATVVAASQSEQHRRAVIITSDFANIGSYSTMTLDDPHTVHVNLARIHYDAVGRVSQEHLYVVNRLGQDNLQVIKPASGKSLAACSIENGSNPQDIAFVGKDKAYVSRMSDGIVTIVDPTVPRTCSGFKLGRIDLSEFADADGSPELGRMLVVGSRLYVAVSRLDRNRGFLPAALGLIAVIDTTTDTLVDADPTTPEVDAIRLAGRNPSGMVYDPSSGKIWVWEVGSFYATDDGGIEAIDPITNRAEGFITTEADLGGTVTVAAPYTASRAFAIVADEDFRNRLVAFSPATGESLETLRKGSLTSYFPDVAVNDRGEVWLADRTLVEPGIRIFDAESGQAMSGSIDVGLPPFAILFMG